MNNSNQNLEEFKRDVTRWLSIDQEIKDLNKKVKSLRDEKNKQLEPKITLFMVHNNIKDLNTESGKLKCSEKQTKSGLSSKHIRDNLSKILSNDVVDKAMDEILNNRTIKKSYKITKTKS
jgi:hypothetical protein